MDDILSATDTDQIARKSSNRSGRSDHIEIVTRSERRRWSLEQKREIVAESLARMQALRMACPLNLGFKQTGLKVSFLSR